MNPTNDVFEARIAALEGGKAAVATASGAAAITYSILNIAGTGSHIVSANTVYGGTYNLFENTLPEYGIECTFVDPDKPENFEKAIRENTKAIFLESLGNPNSNIIDLEAVAKIAHAHGLPVIVDNTFATPYLFRPLEHGADIVVHSATKFIGGHGAALGGVIIDGGTFNWKGSGRFPRLINPDPSYHGISFTEAAGDIAYAFRARVILLRDTGAALSPFHSFLFIQGLETLSLRVERHNENAEKIAAYLASTPYVEIVNHPSLPYNRYHALAQKYFPKGSGSIFTFRIKGNEKEAKAWIDALDIFSILANVADAKSLAIHPATTTHSQLEGADLEKAGIYPNTIRLSIGIENAQDLIEDMEQAFGKVYNK